LESDVSCPAERNRSARPRRAFGLKAVGDAYYRSCHVVPPAAILRWNLAMVANPIRRTFCGE